MKIAIVALMVCSIFCKSSAVASTPMTYKDSVKAEVQMYIDAIKPLVEAATGSNKIGGLPENVVYGLLSLIAMAIIMGIHRKKIAQQNASHLEATKAQNDTHAGLIDKIISKQ